MNAPLRSRRPRPAPRAVPALVLALALVVPGAGCATAASPFVPDGGDLTLTEAAALVDSAAPGDAGGIDTATAAARRQQVLTRLRREGADGTHAADLLTKGFPPDMAAVPVLVEIASVDGTKCLVAVEVVPGTKGRPDRRRLWLIRWSDGGVAYSAVGR